ncbi:hypothetical protein ACQ4PT_006473 [Festuca glaucescens]
MGGADCNSTDFGAAAYWDARYSSPSTGGKGRGGFFDWYQAYPALRPILRACVPTSSRVLMLGCGNSLLSEDMVKDGYEDIVNMDISSVVIEQMKEKHMDVPQLTYMQMDVRDMSLFADGSFDCVIDKGTLDAMMCGDDAPHGASRMLAEVARITRPGGIYMLITYGAPKERLTLLNQARCRWEVELYIMPATPEYQLKWSNGAAHAAMEKVKLTVDGQLPPDYVFKDPESNFIYVSYKSDTASENNSIVVGKEETTTSE